MFPHGAAPCHNIYIYIYIQQNGNSSWEQSHDIATSVLSHHYTSRIKHQAHGTGTTPVVFLRSTSPLIVVPLRSHFQNNHICRDNRCHHRPLVIPEPFPQPRPFSPLSLRPPSGAFSTWHATKQPQPRQHRGPHPTAQPRSRRTTAIAPSPVNSTTKPVVIVHSAARISISPSSPSSEQSSSRVSSHETNTSAAK